MNERRKQQKREKAKKSAKRRSKQHSQMKNLREEITKITGDGKITELAIMHANNAVREKFPEVK